jgi:hypothetical protein
MENTARLIARAKDRAERARLAGAAEGGDVDTQVQGRAGSAADDVVDGARSKGKGKGKSKGKGSGRGAKPKSGADEVWCLCRGPAGEGGMVECAGCNDW